MLFREYKHEFICFLYAIYYELKFYTLYRDYMAFHDNRLWLLSHIHNSFISSDDTGICEMVLAPETFKEEVTRVAKDQVIYYFQLPGLS